MNRQLRSLLSVLVAAAIPVTFWLAAEQIPSTRDTSVFKLEIGKSVERGIEPGEIHTYEITLAAGQFVRAIIDQRGVDVMVTVFDAKGNKINVIDSQSGSQGPEPLSLEATSPGSYRLEIKSLEKDNSHGRYEARILELMSPEDYSAHLAQLRARHEDIKNWIRDHAVRLRTVEAGNGFDDLQPLKKLIGSSRIVALGEATHGTRDFFQMKHRMLEFLVHEMGFTVFSIEAPMPEAFDINDYVLTGEGDPEKALAGLYLWPWNTEEVLNMIRWIRKYNEDDDHPRKIKFYGFDMSIIARAVMGAVSYLRKVDPEQASIMEEGLAAVANPFLERDYRSIQAEKKGTQVTLAKSILARFDEHRDDYLRLSSVTDWTLARQYADLIVQNLTNQVSPPTLPVRDSAMAMNVRWILDQEGPDARMILWAHNGHIANIFLSVGSLGWHLRKMFANELVTFGFAFNQGSFQAVDMPPSTEGLRKFTVDAAPAESFDGTLAAAGLSIAAINFHDIPTNGPVAEWFHRAQMTRNIGASYSEQYAKAFLGPQFPQILTHQYDAILFVENTVSARSNRSSLRIPTQTLEAPENLDFENGNAGDPPPGWTSPTGLASFNFQAVTSDDKPRTGKRCGVIKRISEKHYGETYGSLSQKIDATLYRDKKVKLRASVRVEPAGRNDKAYLWLRVLRQGQGSQAQAFYDNMADRPITSNKWIECEISAEVPADAVTIEFGLAFVGDGKTSIDDVSLEAVGGGQSSGCPMNHN